MTILHRIYENTNVSKRNYILKNLIFIESQLVSTISLDFSFSYNHRYNCFTLFLFTNINKVKTVVLAYKGDFLY